MTVNHEGEIKELGDASQLDEKDIKKDAKWKSTVQVQGVWKRSN